MPGGHPPFLVVGHLNKAHGTKGELFAWPLTDYPESHFAPGIVHLPGDDAAEEPSPSLPALTIEEVRPYRRGFLVKFRGVDDRTGADRLRGTYLLRPFDAIDDLAEGEVFYHELLGAAVTTRGGRLLGEVTEVFPVRPSDLLQVAGPTGEVMIPFNRKMVVDFDRERRRVVVDLPPGFLDPPPGRADPPPGRADARPSHADPPPGSGP